MNYRGISLLNVVGKIFIKVLNARLVNWAESRSLMKQEQIGYRKGCSTVDHLFSLQACVQKYLSKPRGRLYILYVDFSKAFDSINHDLMWYVMMKNGCHGNFLNVLRNMYNMLISCVKTGPDRISKYFCCEIGTRQGCMISPTLFVQFLNEYINILDSCGCEGLYVTDDLCNLVALLYADDMGNLADIVGRLQKILESLSLFCSMYGMNVNLKKNTDHGVP